MNVFLNYVISIFIGAIIGYVTNWLAIKMLFRPRREVRIMGRKLPFTPGLIPKERFRIANSVGKTIGEHLLTKETLVEALANEKMDKHIKKWIGDKVRAIKNSKSSFRELLSRSLESNYEVYIERVSNKAAVKVKELLQVPESKERLVEVTRNILKNVGNTSTDTIINSKYALQAKEFTVEKLIELRASENFKNKLKEYMENRLEVLKNSDKVLVDVIPEGIIASIKVYVYTSRKDICDTIQHLLKEPTVSERLKSAIASMISSNLNSLVAAFIKVDTVYGKLSSALEDYFKEDENQRNVVMLINDGIEKLSKEKISELFNKVSLEDRGVLTEALVNLVSEKILTDELINNIFSEMEQAAAKYSTLDELLSKINESYLEFAAEFIVEKFDELIRGEKSEGIIKNIVSKGVEEVLKATPFDVIGDDEEAIINAVTAAWETIFHRFLANDALEVIEAMDIPQIVENRINSFDVAFAEEIIISLANKELNAITWLGALLGAVMGILSPLLASLY